MSIGNTIKRLRLEKGWTQEELGEKLGVKKAAVQKYESGQVQNLKQSTIKQLCLLFETSPSSFIFNEAEKRLSAEVELVGLMQLAYGKELVELLHCFLGLDDEGKHKLLNYASDLSALQTLRKSHLVQDESQ